MQLVVLSKYTPLVAVRTAGGETVYRTTKVHQAALENGSNSSAQVRFGCEASPLGAATMAAATLQPHHTGFVSVI